MLSTLAARNPRPTDALIHAVGTILLVVLALVAAIGTTDRLRYDLGGAVDATVEVSTADLATSLVRTAVVNVGNDYNPSTNSYATNGATGLYDDVLRVSDDALQGLSTSQRRAVQSLQTQIESHQQKLADYIANPNAYDNLGFLRNAPTEQIRQQIIQGRVGHLEHEMATFADQIRKILGGG